MACTNAGSSLYPIEVKMTKTESRLFYYWVEQFEETGPNTPFKGTAYVLKMLGVNNRRRAARGRRSEK